MHPSVSCCWQHGDVLRFDVLLALLNCSSFVLSSAITAAGASPAAVLRFCVDTFSLNFFEKLHAESGEGLGLSLLGDGFMNAGTGSPGRWWQDACRAMEAEVGWIIHAWVNKTI